MQRHAAGLAGPHPAGDLVAPALWTIDPERSSVRFRVRHLGVARVGGRFTRFEGTLDAREPGGVRVEGAVETASVETGEPIRDERLRTDFFEAAAHPRMAFCAERVVAARGGVWLVAGTLTIKGTSREVVLRVEREQAGDGLVRLRARGSLSRREFGLEWSALVEAGKLVVSDRVELDMRIVAARTG